MGVDYRQMFPYIEGKPKDEYLNSVLSDQNRLSDTLGIPPGTPNRPGSLQSIIDRLRSRNASYKDRLRQQMLERKMRTEAYRQEQMRGMDKPMFDEDAEWQKEDRQMEHLLNTEPWIEPQNQPYMPEAESPFGSSVFGPRKRVI